MSNLFHISTDLLAAVTGGADDKPVDPKAALYRAYNDCLDWAPFQRTPWFGNADDRAKAATDARKDCPVPSLLKQ